MQKIKRALISVSDKTSLEELAATLAGHQVELIASGGSAAFLGERGHQVRAVQEITGNPEAFGGRLKTLSFQLAAALLFRRGHPDDKACAQQLGVEPIDLVVCNLYPFGQVAQRGGSWEELIENIDIGGPTLIRAAAKNCAAVAVLTCPQDYSEFVRRLQEHGGALPLAYRKELARKAYARSAHYDGIVASTLEERAGQVPLTRTFSGESARPLRYGENPHQRAWLVGQGWGRLLQGKELSYNNLLDADAAWACCCDLAAKNSACAVLVKHASPCGAARGETALAALQGAWRGDPVSAFGSVIALDAEVDLECARWLADKFVEVLIAPAFSAPARDLLAGKKSLRLVCPEVNTERLRWRSTVFGMLVQEEDPRPGQQYASVTKRAFPRELFGLADFGVTVAKHIKSNAIALVAASGEGFFLAGAGGGNPNRHFSVLQALGKARENGISDLSKSLLVSDAFFPFRDGIDTAATAGVCQIVQPGGSRRDSEVIAACDEHHIAMAFTGRRHFRH